VTLIERTHDRSLARGEEGADDRGDDAAPPMASGMFTSNGEVAKKIAASTMVATAVPHRSNRSAAMLAQSPTLSPTLSAIVAGCADHPSGMPASTC
jgi:hypothetical protein